MDDAASRVTQISNADAVINNVYFNDNQLSSQEEWAIACAPYHHIVNYTYDVDGNRATIAYPYGKEFTTMATPAAINSGLSGTFLMAFTKPLTFMT